MFHMNQKKEAIRKRTDFCRAAPKHIRSAESWLFLPPASQRLSGNVIIEESSMGSLAVLSLPCIPCSGGKSSIGDPATSARFVQVQVFSLEGRFPHEDISPQEVSIDHFSMFCRN